MDDFREMVLLVYPNGSHMVVTAAQAATMNKPLFGATIRQLADEAKEVARTKGVDKHCKKLAESMLAWGKA